MDDATSEVMTARFEMSETTKGYFRLMKDHHKPSKNHPWKRFVKKNHGEIRI
jgi:hypothetical protein